MTFVEMLHVDNLRSLYKAQLSAKSTKGVDGIMPSAFRTDTELSIIERKCLNDTYEFSPYLEKLVSKGVNKNPRVLSVATVRDRLTLIVLKEYLNDIYADCINRELPNKKVGDIYSFMQKNPNFKYLKTDIKGFYENIHHEKLLNTLKKRITDKHVLILIEKAITTPTFCSSVPKLDRINKKNIKGIPQGLAVSNILAEIYLSELDAFMHKKKLSFYSRYVDDILIIMPKKVSEMKTELTSILRNLDLQLNKAKTKIAKVQDGVLFLGYNIKDDMIFIPEKKISLFLTRIAGLFTEYEKMFMNNALRPIVFKTNDKGLRDFFIETLNKKITGASSQLKRYGWISYYSQITDYSIFYRIDRKIQEFCKKSNLLGKEIPNELKSLHRTYFEIRYNYKDSDYIYNYDKIDTVSKKLGALRKANLIVGDAITEEQIIILYEKLKQKELKSFEKDAGFMTGSISG